MLAVRAWMFSLYTVGTNALQPQLRAGDRVMVNLMSHSYRRGDLVLVGDSAATIGVVRAVPGDTIRQAGGLFVIPNACHHGCDCSVCRLFLIGVGRQQRLFPAGSIRGKAYPLNSISL